MAASEPPAPPPSPRVGRLAPSPTGDLHLGNLSSALLAWAQARSCGARLVLRVEDLDGPRVVPGCATQQIADLRALGIEWDEGPDVGGPKGPYVQSERTAHYERAMARLAAEDLVYPCWCSRRDIDDVLSAPHSHFDPRTAYPGTCARLGADERAARSGAEHAWRFRARGVTEVDERVVEPVRVDVAVDPGDFVVRRRDGLFAYQLAVVVDDLAMGITDVVRGRDLLDSAPRQVALARALGGSPPAYWHLPMLLDERGGRLAKRSASGGLAALAAAGWDAAGVRGLLLWLWGARERPEPAAIDEVAAAFATLELGRPEIRVPDAVFEDAEAFRASAHAQDRST